MVIPKPPLSESLSGGRGCVNREFNGLWAIDVNRDGVGGCGESEGRRLAPPSSACRP